MKSFVRIAIATSLLAFAQTSLASSYVTCGIGGFDEDKGDFVQPVFGISSEDDKYAGVLGKKWYMKLDNEWVEDSESIKARTTKEDGKVIVTITRKMGDSLGGVGVKYVVSDIYADEPTLVIEQFGGVAGSLKQTYECVSMND